MIFLSFLSQENEINLAIYKNKFCNTNVLNISKSLKKRIKDEINDATKIYDEHFKRPRNEIFAHMDDILLSNEDVEKLMQTSSETTKKLLNLLIKVMRQIWKSYKGQNLCFSLKKGNDYKKITKILCVKYGDTRFL